MNPDHIPNEEHVIIDANVILYAVQQVSQQCKRLLLRCAGEEIKGILPAHILAEVMHQFMIAEARDNCWIKGSNPARQLSESPELVQKLTRYENMMRDLLAVGLQIEPLEQQDFLNALTVQRQYGLLTNDALMVAIAQRLRVEVLASADKIFSRLKEMHVYSPDDLVI